MPLGSLRSQPSEDQGANPEKKLVPLEMDMVAACQGIRKEEIEFELNSKRKVYIPLKKVLQQDIDILKKIYLKLNRNYHPSLEASRLILTQISKIRESWTKNQPSKEVLIWNPEGKRVLMEPFYLMF